VRSPWVWGVALGTVLGVWSLSESLWPASPATQQQVADLARNLASGLLLVAGVLGLACWRLTADPLVARKAVALLVLGAGLPQVPTVGPLLNEPAGLAHFAPSTRALLLVPVVALLLPGPRWSRQTFARPIPSRYAAVVVVVTAAVLAALLTARQWLQPEQLPLAWQLLDAAALLAWLVLAVRARREDRARACGQGPTATVAFALLAGCELIRLLSINGNMPAKGLAPGLQLGAATILVWAATADLRAAYHAEAEQAADLTRALSTARHHLARLESAGRERLHDARSAVVGVMGASELLTSARSQVSDADLARLRGLITTELQRLQALLDPREVEETTEFDLAEALGSVVLVHQLDGLAVHATVPSIRVCGKPRAMATVLDNLLRNVRTHAPHAQVRVRAGAGEGAATVVVEDDGPGIPPAERQQVLRPGVRGSAAGEAGEGLGLASCVAAMCQQAGSLLLGEGVDGGTRVTLRLPLAPERPARVDLDAAPSASGLVLASAAGSEALAS
jgi:signal transduction histidine kinase